MNYEELTKNAQGLIKYKEHYVLIDREENAKLIDKVKHPKITDKNKMEILHAAVRRDCRQRPRETETVRHKQRRPAELPPALT